MSFQIQYSRQAREDIRSIYLYIAETLLVPEIASSQTSRIMKSVRTLEDMPSRHKLYEDEPWHSQGVRYFPVDNYLIFYLIEENETVSIIRIMYGGRDIRRQMNETINY